MPAVVKQKTEKFFGKPGTIAGVDELRTFAIEWFRDGDGLLERVLVVQIGDEMRAMPEPEKLFGSLRGLSDSFKSKVLDFHANETKTATPPEDTAAVLDVSPAK